MQDLERLSSTDLNSGSLLAVIIVVYSNLSTRDPLPSVHRLSASIDGLCVPGVLTAVVQPLVNLTDMNIVGFEALTRVPASPPGAPDWWLEQAGELGMRQRLEVACGGERSSNSGPPREMRCSS